MPLRFRLVDQYLGLLLDTEVNALRSGDLHVVETPRRTRREKSYSFVHALHAVFFMDGRVAASVTPGAGQDVRRLLDAWSWDGTEPFGARWLESVKEAVSAARAKASMTPPASISESLVFACDLEHLRCPPANPARRITGEVLPPAEGLSLPAHCFPGGVVFGVVADERVASVAYAHKTGRMEDRIADLGVETAPAYRRRGYAKAAVAAVTAHITDRGGEAIYSCSPRNYASMLTACGVGYKLYATTLTITAPADEEEPAA